jgi:hypothetical protein
MASQGVQQIGVSEATGRKPAARMAEENVGRRRGRVGVLTGGDQVAGSADPRGRCRCFGIGRHPAQVVLQAIRVRVCKSGTADSHWPSKWVFIGLWSLRDLRG